MATSRLDLLLSARNNASPAVKQLAADLRGLDETAKNASKGLGGLATAFGVAGVAALVTEMGRAGLEMVELAGRAQRVEDAFQSLANQAGLSSREVLAELQGVSQGLISETDLMLAANRALIGGVADNAQELGDLMQIAIARARTFGRDAGDAFNRLIEGLAKAEVEVLDELGLTIRLEEATRRYADSIGVAVTDLDAQQRTQALVNEVLRQAEGDLRDAGSQSLTTAEQVKTLKIAWQELRTVMGEQLAGAGIEEGGGIAGALRGALEAVTGYSSVQAELERAVERTSQQLEEWRTILASGAPTAGLAAHNVEFLEQRLLELRAELTIVDGTLESYALAAEAAGLHSQTMAQGVQLSAAALAQIRAQAEVTTPVIIGLLYAVQGFAAAMAGVDQLQLQGIERLKSAALGAVDLFGAAEAQGRFDEARNSLIEMQELWRAQGRGVEEIAFLSEAYIRDFTSGIGDIRSEMAKLERGTDSYASALRDAEAEAERAFGRIESAVSSVLSAALDVGVGIDFSELLPRADAINEDARRLADVAVHGFESPWADYFRTHFPQLFDDLFFAADPKAAAARLLQEFEQGLRPELINRELVKERVRAMLVGDQNMAELAREIASELAAEMGVPLTEALAATQGALGVAGADLTASGESAGQSFAVGAQGSMAGVGEEVVSGFLDAMAKMYERIATAGAEAGKHWGQGFLTTVGENVPPALVDILTNLVTPAVQAGLITQAGLTGAE